MQPAYLKKWRYSWVLEYQLTHTSGNKIKSLARTGTSFLEISSSSKSGLKAIHVFGFYSWYERVTGMAKEGCTFLLPLSTKFFLYSFQLSC